MIAGIIMMIAENIMDRAVWEEQEWAASVRLLED